MNQPQCAKQVERGEEPQRCKDEAKQRTGQCEAVIYRLQNYIQRAEQNDAARAVEQEECNREPELSLVRQDVSRRLDRVARNDQRIQQRVIADYNNDKREQAGNPRDLRRSSLSPRNRCELRGHRYHAAANAAGAGGGGEALEPLIKSQSMIANSPNQNGCA